MQANTASISSPGAQGADLTRSGQAAQAHDVRWFGCSRCNGNTVPTGFGLRRWSCAFKGWNDAADAASAAMTFVGSALGARRFATIDPEDFYDFQATRPRIKLVEGQTREIVWPVVELFEARVPRAPRDLILLVGQRALVPLADVRQADRRARRGAWRAARGHARRASGRRPAHAPGLGDRACLGPGAHRPAGTDLVLLRGPDRHHRRAPCRLPGGRPALGEPVGRRAALHRRHAQPQGGTRARAQARGPRRSRRRRSELEIAPPTTSARSTWPCRAIPTCRPSSSASNRPPATSPTTIRAHSPRARRSRETSSASSASAAGGRLRTRPT